MLDIQGNKLLIDPANSKPYYFFISSFPEITLVRPTTEIISLKPYGLAYGYLDSDSELKPNPYIIFVPISDSVWSLHILDVAIFTEGKNVIHLVFEDQNGSPIMDSIEILWQNNMKFSTNIDLSASIRPEPLPDSTPRVVNQVNLPVPVTAWNKGEGSFELWYETSKGWIWSGRAELIIPLLSDYKLDVTTDKKNAMSILDAFVGPTNP